MKSKIIAVLLAFVLASSSIGAMSAMASETDAQGDMVEFQVQNEPAMAGNAVTSGSCGDNATWTLTGSGTDLTLTIDGTGAIDDYPSAINQNTSPIPWFSYRTKIKTIIINNGITTIGDFAFCKCSSVVKTVLPESLTTIRQWAFYNCSKLADITFPDGLTQIEESAFSGCSSLTAITIPDGMTRVGDSVFQNCTRLKSVTLPDGVTEIGTYAFAGCSRLTDIAIPDGVTSIGWSAFDACTSLTGIDLPDGLTEISDNMFYHCIKLETITIPEGVTRIGWGAFCECYALEEIIIPESVTELGDSVFEDCTSLTGIELPDGLTQIPFEAFQRCTSLTQIDLPDGLEKIGELAFASCSSLTGVKIPDGVEEIGVRAFHDCGALSFLAIPDSVTEILDYAFGEAKTISILFRGTPEEWDDAVAGSVVLYKSLSFGGFSADAEFALAKTAFNYTGAPIEPEVTVTCEGQQLVEGTDYTVSYENNVNLGTGTVTVTGIGEYSGTVQLLFEIRLGSTSKVTCKNLAEGMKVSWESVTGARWYNVYRDGVHVLTTSRLYGLDKDVRRSSGKKFKYKVVAVDRDNAESELFRTCTYYRLLPVKITRLSNPSAGKMKVEYDKSPGCYGYVVRYGLKSDMSDASVVSVKGANTLSRTFGGMKKGKTYYVQVRTYMLENGVRYYSGYCTTQKITIRK